jgi:hypothetical protein
MLSFEFSEIKVLTWSIFTWGGMDSVTISLRDSMICSDYVLWVEIVFYVFWVFLRYSISDSMMSVSIDDIWSALSEARIDFNFDIICSG